MTTRTCAALLALTLFSACSGSGPEVAPVFPAVADGPYAGVLKDCARSGGHQRSCTFRELPMLGMQSTDPQIEDLMQRVATTHPWMAERFAEVLAGTPPEILRLSRSVTAVIIGSDVRPSFYWQRTGAIYLDPAHLWLTLEEKHSIDPAPDYRAGFGVELPFRIISRYVRGNAYAWFNYSLEDESTRDFEDLLAPLTRLLFHELAHANDFFPQDRMSALSKSMSVEEAAALIIDRGWQVSQDLERHIPLDSEIMRDIAQVFFAGATPDATLMAMRPEDVVPHFSADGASDEYNYFSRYEDLAMLFEELMMDASFGIRRDLAITDAPEPGADYIVAWGQRGRIAEQAVSARALHVARQLLPEKDFFAYLAEREPVKMLRPGASWMDNLDPDAAGKARSDLLPQPFDPYDEVR